jgi:hypothetical protein
MHRGEGTYFLAHSHSYLQAASSRGQKRSNLNTYTVQHDYLLQTELMYLVERYYARRFHGTVYFLNQLSSDLDRWEALPEHVS